MSRIAAIVSQKGGVGKTSLVQNLGAELAKFKQRVLVVDFDPQSNLTTGCGVDPAIERPTIYEAMLDPTQVRTCIVHRETNLDLMPANLDLAGAERQFAGDFDRNSKLKGVLGTIADDYDFVLIDCPPSLGFYTANALVAATEALVPLQCHAYAYKALDSLLALIAQAQKVNPKLKLSAVVLTMYDVRNSLTVAVEEAARERFNSLVTKTVIPVNVRIADAPLHGISVGEHDPRSKGAQAYKALAKEILKRG
jgi:chromosome partitioning protein